jgi:hypothetical protein
MINFLFNLFAHQPTNDRETRSFGQGFGVEISIHLKHPHLFNSNAMAFEFGPGVPD